MEHQRAYMFGMNPPTLPLQGKDAPSKGCHRRFIMSHVWINLDFVLGSETCGVMVDVLRSLLHKATQTVYWLGGYPSTLAGAPIEVARKQCFVPVRPTLGQLSCPIICAKLTESLPPPIMPPDWPGILIAVASSRSELQHHHNA